MRFRTAFLTLGASLLLTCHASAQVIDCACASAYEVGDRVVALVDNPASAIDLPAGTVGTVVCGLNPPIGGLEILIRWDGWAIGDNVNVNGCDCPVNPGGGTNADWYVTCSEIALAPVRNVTQSTAFGTLQAALDAAANNDVIEIDPVTLMEDGVVAPAGLNVTIRGAGTDQTIIDGMGNASQSDAILAFSNSTNVVVSDLTLRNGLSTTLRTAGALQLTNTSITCRGVDFVNSSNTSGQIGGGHLFADAGNWSFTGCTFRGGSGGDAISVRNGVLSFTQCLLVQDSPFIALQNSNTPATLLNCTVVGAVRPVDSLFTLTNSTVDGILFLQFNGTLSASRSLFAGATGDNIDGVPTFVDGTGGDYRLAPGSLGIDAADADAFFAASTSFFDLSGAPRLSNDSSTPDTGVGVSTSLDIGAYEFQGVSTPPGACPGDINGDGRTDLSDFNILGINFGCDSN